MKCPNCGAKIDDDSIFCMECGKKIQKIKEKGRIKAPPPGEKEVVTRPSEKDSRSSKTVQRKKLILILAISIPVVLISATFGILGGLKVFSKEEVREVTKGSFEENQAVPENEVEETPLEEDAITDENFSEGEENNHIEPFSVGDNNTYGIFIEGNYAFISGRNTNLIIVDVTNIGDPKVVGECKVPGVSYNVYVNDDYAYINYVVLDDDGNFTEESGLQIIDVSNKNNPNVIGSCQTGVTCYETFVEDDYAYAANGQGGFKIIDIKDKENPNIIGGCTTKAAIGIAKMDSYVYIADWSGGLQIIDVSDKNNPSIIGSCETGDKAIRVFVENDYAFVANEEGGLKIIDLSDKYNPVITGECNTIDSANSVFIKGNLAYIADIEGGLIIVDINNKNNPVLLDSYETPGSAWDLYIKDSYVYIIDTSGFLSIKSIES